VDRRTDVYSRNCGELLEQVYEREGVTIADQQGRLTMIRERCIRVEDIRENHVKLRQWTRSLFAGGTRTEKVGAALPLQTHAFLREIVRFG